MNDRTLPLVHCDHPSTGSTNFASKPIAFLLLKRFDFDLSNPIQMFPVHRGTNTIGRMDDCSIQIDSVVVSRYHACIEVEGLSHFYYDKSSFNGSERRGFPLKPYVYYELKDGTRLSIGGIQGVYLLASAQPPLIMNHWHHMQGASQNNTVLSQDLFAHMFEEENDTESDAADETVQVRFNHEEPTEQAVEFRIAERPVLRRLVPAPLIHSPETNDVVPTRQIVEPRIVERPALRRLVPLPVIHSPEPIDEAPTQPVLEPRLAERPALKRLVHSPTLIHSPEPAVSTVDPNDAMLTMSPVSSKSVVLVYETPKAYSKTNQNRRTSTPILNSSPFKFSYASSNSSSAKRSKMHSVENVPVNQRLEVAFERKTVSTIRIESASASFAPEPIRASWNAIQDFFMDFNNRNSRRPDEPDLPVKILFSGVDSIPWVRPIRELGGLVTGDPYQATHLVIKKVKKSLKVLIAITRGLPIVTVKWLKESQTKQYFVDTALYESKLLKDALLRARASQGTLLKGYHFFGTPSVRPNPQCLKQLIHCAGGIFHEDLEEFETICKRFPHHCILLAKKRDFMQPNYPTLRSVFLCAPLVGAMLQVPEFLYSTLMNQQIDLYEYSFNSTPAVEDSLEYSF